MLIAILKKAVTKTANEKIALDAQKARALAKSVGLIPHYKSNWKWALRQMRAPSINAIDDNLMLSGQELVKAKEQIGLLSNNDFQKIKAFSRQHGSHSKEVALQNSTLYGGSHHKVRVSDNPFLRTTHTHPLSDLVSIMQDMSRGKNVAEIHRLFDDALAASPSGLLGNEDKIRRWLRAIDTSRSATKDLLTTVPANKAQARKAIRELKRRSSRSVFGEHAPIESIPVRNNMEMVDLLLGAKTLPGKFGDLSGIANNLNIRPENIISRKATGVHKFRPKHERLLRSVYFDKGLDT